MSDLFDVQNYMFWECSYLEQPSWQLFQSALCQGLWQSTQNWEKFPRRSRTFVKGKVDPPGYTRVKYDSCPQTQDHTTVDNLRDEYPSTKPRIHENYWMRVACCEHSWMYSDVKGVSLTTEYYEATMMLPRPLKRKRTAMITDNMTCHLLVYFKPPDVCSSGEDRKRHFMLIDWFLS